MSDFYKYCLLVFFLFCAFGLVAQETTDSLRLRFKVQREAILIDRNWNLEYPTLNEVTLPKPNFDKFLFEGNWNEKFKPSYQTLSLPNNQELHNYSGKAFSSYVVKNPLSIGFEYHLKPVFGWQKLDIYFFGQGLLFNQNLLGEYQFGIAPPDGRGFYWEAGVGIEYEFNDHWSVFYEYSPSFMNKTFLGTKNKAGLRYRVQ